MTDVISSSADVVVEVQQPTVPPAALPPKIGLVEINQVVQRGSAWMTGSGPPTNAGGQYGDMYLDTTTGDIYLWDGNSWNYEGTFAPSTLTAAEILAELITVDGAGSGLDADLLDGHDSPYFATATALTTEKNRNDTQDSQINSNTNSIATNANAISDLQTATTPANLLTSIKTVDGSGSGLDADTLDGHDTSYFGTAAADTTLQNNINLKANIASPVFTGDPQAPTPAVSDNDTSIATTAFVKSVTATIVPFPEAPNDGLTYGRKNSSWSTVIGGAATSDTPPPGPLVSGQLWWKSDTGTFYVYYQDVNSAAWVEAAAPAVPAAAYVQKTARRSNLVINGALNVSQENGNTEGTVSGYFGADQFLCGFGASGAAFGFGRIATANSSGSQYRLRYRVTTAKATLVSGDYAAIVTRMEGLNVQDLAWSVAGQQKDAVLAFGFNGPAGTYSVAIRNFNGSTVTHTFLATITITAGQANTDTTQVIKVPAPVGMTSWTVDNSPCIEIYITLAGDPTKLGTAGWNSGPFQGVTGMSNGLAAVQSFQVWDLYFGADPDKTGVPPVFEVPDYETELLKCYRYWQQFRTYIAGYGTGAGYQGRFSSTITPMRAAPSAAFVGASNTNCTGPTLYAAGINYLGLIATSSATSAFTSDATTTLNSRM